MDFQAFQKQLAPLYPKFSQRKIRLMALKRARKGKLYVDRAYDFTTEKENDLGGPRVELDKRRAAVQYMLPHMIVRDTVSMLLGEEHRPVVLVRDDDNSNDWIMSFIEDTRVWWHLTNAATEGSDGACAWVMRVLPANGPGKPGRFYHEIWPAVECDPEFKREAPDQLKRLPRTYFVTEDALRADGYDVEKLKEKWEKSDGRTKLGKARGNAIGSGTIGEWAMRVVLDDQTETWCEPVPRYVFEQADFDTPDNPWLVDTLRKPYEHKVGETPAVWIPNGPGDIELHPDGPCTYMPAIDFQLRIDRTLSQTGRALDYAGDPQYAESTGQGGGSGSFGEMEGDMDATASGVITVPEKGGAWFVEIKGEGLKVAIELYVKLLRELAREVAGGSRIDPESAQVGKLSGVAMKMLNAALIWSTSLGRQAYGELGLIPVIKLAMRIYDKVKVELPTLKARLDRRQADAQRRGAVQKATAAASDMLKDPTLSTGCGGGCGCCDNCVDGCDGNCCDKCGTGPNAQTFDGNPDPDAYIELSWPAYYEPDGQDFAQQVAGIVAAVEGKIISAETGVANAAALFDVRDSEKEQDRIKDEQVLNRASTAADAKLQAQNEAGPGGPPASKG